MKNITIVTSGHPPTDERIFYKIGHTLKNYGYKVTIVCSNLEINIEKNGIVLSGFDGNQLPKNKKISLLEEYIARSVPEIIICCEPLTIIPAYHYKKKSETRVSLISDITEWYPENVALKLNGWKIITEYLKLYLFNIYTINLSDAIIIGEISKKKRYQIIAPFKPKTILSYYPVLKYFPKVQNVNSSNEFILGYAGIITFERGIISLLKTAEKLAERYPEKQIKLIIAGKFQYKHEEEIFMKMTGEVQKVIIEFCKWVDYSEIWKLIKNMDVCFDLRKHTFIYRNSLPIKIFEYMACSKPVIYSDIKVIRNELPVKKFGFLVDPENLDQILEAAENYISDPILLERHSTEARRLVEQKYNWESLENILLKFISEIHP